MLRLPHLTLQPIFADEAIYIRWAQVMRAEQTLRFLPLSDGKTPLYMWAMIPLFKFIHDPLLAGRLLSVLSGFLTLSGLFLLSRKVIGNKGAFITAFLYIITPYSLFFDRMALVDSMLAAFTIWSLFLAVLILEKQRWDQAMVLGYLMGGGMLTKTPGMFNLLVLPLSFLGFNFKKQKREAFFKLLLNWVVAFVIALVIYNILRLGPNFQMLSMRNSDYVFSLADLKARPLDPLIPHLGDVFTWIIGLFSLPTFLLTAVGTVFSLIKRKPLIWVVLVWSLAPALIQMAMLKTFTARYLLSSVAPLLIVSAYGLEELSLLITKTKQLNFLPKKSFLAALLVLVSLFPFYMDYKIISKPQAAPLPKSERGYIDSWTAGYGFAQIAQFLIEKKKQGPVVVGTEGYFGTLPDGLQIYLDKSDIPVIGGSATISAQLRESARLNQTYFVANRSRVGDNLKGVQLLMEFKKAAPVDGKPQDAIVVYQVFPL